MTATRFDVPIPTAEPAVPFVDLGRGHRALAPDMTAAFRRVIDSSGFILGEEVERFEAEFAEYCGVRHCVGVASGTAALALALVAAGIGPGDEVIVPAHTYVASGLAVLHAGATPVFCDVEDGTGLIDAESAGAVITGRTAAIVAVHLYGQACDMTTLAGLADRHGLMLLEDAAQAHGATYRGRRAGSLGTAAGFSFYPSKNLGCLGDGGAVCTGDPGIAERVRQLRNLGQRDKGEHLRAGFNARLDGLQAAFLRVKLARLDAGNRARRSRADGYRDALPDSVRPLEVRADSPCIYHLFPVRVSDREAVAARMRRRGIGVGIHYSPPLHQQPPLAGHAPQPGLTVAEAWAREELSLPMFAELEPSEVARVAEALAASLPTDAGWTPHDVR